MGVVRSLIAPAPAEASAPARVLVVDVLGEVFDRLRELSLPVALWRLLDARRMASNLAIDLVVFAAYGPIDWEMAAQISSRAPTLIITTTYQRSEAEQALRRDLIGYLDAGIARPALDRALRGAVSQDEPAFPRELIGAWMREQRESADAANATANGLTTRQREILALIAQGATDKEIAAALGIAIPTAQKHVSNMLRRLEVPNRAAAVATMSRVVPADGAATERRRRRPDSVRGAAERVAVPAMTRDGSVVAIAGTRAEHTNRRAS